MDFGSKFIYTYDLSDEECISDDEFEDGMELSDSDEEDAVPSLPPRTTPQLSSVVMDVNTVESMHLMGDALPEAPQPTLAQAPPPPPPPSRGRSFFSLPGFLGGSRGSRRSQDLPRFHSAEIPEKKKSKKTHHWRAAKSNEHRTVAPGLKGKRYRRADTNVVKIKFETLTKPSHMHTGEAEYCSQCRAVLSHLSKVPKDTDIDQVWECEFCSHKNPVDLVAEELPQDEDVTYMLEPAPATAATSKSGVDSSLIVFCIDISGSMCVTTEVPGKVRLRGDRLDALQSLNDENENQFMPGQRRNVTYVSRLQGVQAAIDQQLAEMQKDHPHRRVALVTFNSDVAVIGDGSGEPLHLAKHRLSDKEELIKIGLELALPSSVKDSRTVLGDKVFDLEEGGATALGPALLLSVAMASQAPGSKVIMCTDGMANVGLGSLEDPTEEKMEEAAELYTAVGNLATDKGVSVSVISIKGANCKLVQLGRVADMTGGQVNIVDPLQLTSQFGSILADPVIATNVVATFITNTGLYIRNNDSQSQEMNCVERVVGNVTADTEISFEFGVKRTAKKGAKKDDEASGEAADAVAVAGSFDAATPGPSHQQETTKPQTKGQEKAEKAESKKKEEANKELPFQLQITYTDIEGAKALRVLTQCKPVTKERKVAEQYLNVAVLGTHVAQRSAALASEGKYSNARGMAMMQQRLMARHKWDHGSEPEVKDAYQNIFSNIQKLDGQLNQRQQSEVRTRGARYSDDEGSDEEDMVMSASLGGASKPMKKKKSLLRKARTAECDDSLANTTYQLKQSNFSKFLKKK